MTIGMRRSGQVGSLEGHRPRPARRSPVCLIALVLISLAAAPAGDLRAQLLSGRVIVGTVVSVQSSSVTVRLPNLLGYLRVRVSTYRVRRPGSLIGLRPGDKISGVLSRADGMLHRVRRIETVKQLERNL